MVTRRHGWYYFYFTWEDARAQSLKCPAGVTRLEQGTAGYLTLSLGVPSILTCGCSDSALRTAGLCGGILGVLQTLNIFLPWKERVKPLENLKSNLILCIQSITTEKVLHTHRCTHMHKFTHSPSRYVCLSVYMESVHVCVSL